MPRTKAEFNWWHNYKERSNEGFLQEQKCAVDVQTSGGWSNRGTSARGGNRDSPGSSSSIPLTFPIPLFQVHFCFLFSSRCSFPRLDNSALRRCPRAEIGRLKRYLFLSLNDKKLLFFLVYNNNIIINNNKDKYALTVIIVHPGESLCSAKCWRKKTSEGQEGSSSCVTFQIKITPKKPLKTDYL